MKHLLLLLLLLWLPLSCTHIAGNAQLGTYSMTSVGGNHKGYSQSAKGVSFNDGNNSDSMKEVAGVVKNVIQTQALASVAKTLSAHTLSGLKSKETTARVLDGNKTAVEQSRIQADVTKSTFVPPETPAAAPAAP